MKNFVFLLTFLGCCLVAYPLKVPVYGKSGVVVNPDGTYKICPGWALHKCATIEIHFKSIPSESISSESTDAGIPITIELYDEQERVIQYIEAKVYGAYSEADLNANLDNVIIK